VPAKNVRVTLAKRAKAVAVNAAVAGGVARAVSAKIVRKAAKLRPEAKLPSRLASRSKPRLRMKRSPNRAAAVADVANKTKVRTSRR